MEFHKGYILEDRYQFLSPLGSGATAQVWLAHDKLANLRVAVKVFDSIEGDGISDFQKEFATVYNINHQNLLTPTNYSVSGYVPYLVMPFCENGSTQSMVGKCSQSDIVPFIRDVAAALACLHANSIVHQDIKPENILIDDNLNFKVTDFGISTSRDDSNLTYGGTFPYMSAERFNGVLEPSGDIWGLGATIFELLEGETPFGDDGGINQAQGNPVPPITKTKVDPYLYNLICSMLDPDPAQRPSADKIHADMEFFLRYKRWPGPSAIKQYSIAVGIVVLVAAVLAIWGYNRTKVYYCQDYVEIYGEPQMIDKLTGSEHQARIFSYRVEKQAGHVRRVTLVNNADSCIAPDDYRRIPLRYPDQKYDYSNGRLQVICSDQNHCEVIRYTYVSDDQIEFFGPDGKKIFYTSNYSSMNTDGLYRGTSCIAKMRLVYDGQGRVAKRIYIGIHDYEITDASEATGHKLTYDKDGHITSITHINSERNRKMPDATGCATRRFSYDDKGNLTLVQMLDPDSIPVCDYQGRARICIEYNEDGNPIKESNYDTHNNLTPRRSDGVYSTSIEYTDQGIYYSYLGPNGEPVLCNSGFAYAFMKINPDNGHPASWQFKDVNENFVYGLQLDYDNNARIIRRSYIDQNGNKTSGPEGFSYFELQYDGSGHIIETRYFDAGGNKVQFFDTHRVSYNYDAQGRGTSSTNYNVDNVIAPNLYQYCISKYEYDDNWTAPKSISYRDANNVPVNCSDGYATEQNSFDDIGRLTDVYYKDANDAPATLFGAISHINFSYNGARVARVCGFKGSSTDAVCTIDVSFTNDGLALLYDPQIAPIPVAFKEESDGDSRSVYAIDSDGNPTNVTMPNGAVAHRLTKRGNDVTCTTVDGSIANADKAAQARVAGSYFIINDFFYNYLLLTPVYLEEQPEPTPTLPPTPTPTPSPTPTPTPTPTTDWKQTILSQGRTAFNGDNGEVWITEYDVNPNNTTITVKVRAKHITSTYDFTDAEREGMSRQNTRIRNLIYYQFGVPESVKVVVKILNNSGAEIQRYRN